MRILITTRYRFVIGGVETYLRALLPLLRERGHEVGLAYEHGGVDAIGLDPKQDAPSWALDAPQAMRDIERWKPHVVYAHGLRRTELENALLDRFPCVSYVHNYAATCVSGSKAHRLPFVRPCEREIGPACLAVYLPCRCGGLNPVTMLRSYYWALENLRTLKRYAVVLVASPHMSHECRKNGLSAARLRVVPYFPPNAHERSAQPTARGVLGTNVLLVGRLVPLKGGIELVDAIALAGQALERRLHLDVAGDGPERDALVSRAKARGIDIHLHGWLDATRLARLMKSVDILAVPSLWPEPFGVVGIEAGYCGLPSVAFATGGIPSWLRPGLSGELAPTPPSVGGLADAIVRALRDPAHLDALRLGAWQVGGEFSCERHITGVEEALVDATRPSKMAEIDRGPELADPESTC